MQDTLGLAVGSRDYPMSKVETRNGQVVAGRFNDNVTIVVTNLKLDRSSLADMTPAQAVELGRQLIALGEGE
jgi:hypothetical protein